MKCYYSMNWVECNFTWQMNSSTCFLFLQHLALYCPLLQSLGTITTQVTNNHSAYSPCIFKALYKVLHHRASSLSPLRIWKLWHKSYVVWCKIRAQTGISCILCLKTRLLMWLRYQCENKGCTGTRSCLAENKEIQKKICVKVCST